jgi:hypothetical protein
MGPARRARARQVAGDQRLEQILHRRNILGRELAVRRTSRPGGRRISVRSLRDFCRTGRATSMPLHDPLADSHPSREHCVGSPSNERPTRRTIAGTSIAGDARGWRLRCPCGLNYPARCCSALNSSSSSSGRQRRVDTQLCALALAADNADDALLNWAPRNPERALFIVGICPFW